MLHYGKNARSIPYKIKEYKDNKLEESDWTRGIGREGDMTWEIERSVVKDPPRSIQGK